MNRRPILQAALGVGSAGALLITFVTDLIDLLVALGMNVELAEPLTKVMSGGVALLMAFGIVKFSESHTTPLSDPRNNEGEPLVAASDLGVAAVQIDQPTMVVPGGDPIPLPRPASEGSDTSMPPPPPGTTYGHPSTSTGT